MLSLNEIRAKAFEFAKEWSEERSEDGEAKSFWDGFFQVFGLPRRRVATFEKPVKKLDERQGFIDLLWKGTLLVEHKSRGRDLDKAVQQAKDYFPGLKDEELPRYILVSDFENFRLYDLETGADSRFRLSELPDNIGLFGFISGYERRTYKEQDPVNQEAAQIMAGLHDAIAGSGFEGHELEVFLMRILFCLFAEDTGIFERDQFREFLELRTADDGSDTGPRLGQLFKALNTPNNKRSTNLDGTVALFEYVNGGLFSELLELPEFNAKQRAALIRCTYFDWSLISPAIFGSLFQGVTDPRRRRTLGAHYTSEKNILKVVSGLFLDELRAEFERAKTNRTRLEALHQSLARITFLDPSCGCGNFLVITYRELRMLEMDIFEAKLKLSGGQTEIGSRLDVNCAHGIEIEEFPARIAETAMWLTDHMMNLKLSQRFGNLYKRIPLQAQAKILNANALRVDWNEVLPAERCTYVLGNPPFVGHTFQDHEQKLDQENVLREIQGSGVLDYVSCFFVKAAYFIQESTIKCAFVSTNSITQGEQVALLWGYLINRKSIKIPFAHRTFQWSNEASGKAAVHCVIVGFQVEEPSGKRLFIYEKPNGEAVEIKCQNINPYLVDGPTVIIPNRSLPISHSPKMVWGSKPSDGGNFILSSDEREDMISKNPLAEKYIRRYVSGENLINDSVRYCLWLIDASPSDLKAMPEVLKRVQAVRESRLASKASITRRKADTPTLFMQIAQPPTNYLAIPEVSSERRPYIPIAYLSKDFIASNKIQLIPNASLYVFGVIISQAHMAWMRSVCGRLKSDYSYSNTLVYNNFPWPQQVTDKQKVAIETAAQAVLDARTVHPGATLAQLYDPLTMPPNLVQAHRKLDALVDKLYNLPTNPTEAQRIARNQLFGNTRSIK